MDTFKLAQSMIEEYRSILERRKKLYPQQAASIRRYFDSQRRLFVRRVFRYSLERLLFISGVKGKKYFIIGLRYREVLTSLPRSQTLLIANSLSEVWFALKNRIQFIYLGMVTEHFLRAFFDGEFRSLLRDITRVVDLLGNTSEKAKYIISTSDTLPPDILFRWIAKQDKGNNSTVCIQHGLIPGRFPEGYLEEGTFSDLFLAMSESQVDAARKVLGEGVSILRCGPPWDIPYVAEEGKPEVILVSQGGFGNDFESAKATLNILKTIDDLLSSKSVLVTYRPHPADVLTGDEVAFSKVDSGPKERVLSGSPRIFIGFASTLLLEAYLAGHTVIGIVYPDQEYGLSFDADFEVDSRDLNQIFEIIANLPMVRKRVRTDRDTRPLVDRLEDVLSQIRLSANSDVTHRPPVSCIT